MDNRRILFKAEDREVFFRRLDDASNMSLAELAEVARVHRRSYFDWKRGKLAPKLSSIALLSQKFNVNLPENEMLLVDRWLKKKRDICRKGAVARMRIYGQLGTPEGRKRGGLNAIKKRRELGNLARVIDKPAESVELAEFMGILLGDGGLSRYQCAIYLNSETDKEFAYYVVDLIERLFNLKAKIFKHKKDKVWRILVSSTNLIKYLEQKGLRLGNKVLLQVGVPDWIWAKPEYVKACIRGLIDTDGCFAIHRYKVNGKQYSYPKIAFSNRSVPILGFVHAGLSELGYKPKNDGRYKVWLYNKNEVKRYLGDIGTRNFKTSFFLDNHSFLEGGPDGKAQVC